MNTETRKLLDQYAAYQNDEYGRLLAAYGEAKRRAIETNRVSAWAKVWQLARQLDALA